MSIIRHDGRLADEMRQVVIKPDYYTYAEGSALVEFGNTKVLCVASFSEGVPSFMKGQGKGWVTAEYSLLPKSTQTRNSRERYKVGGRTQEIQRLVGRALRSVVTLEGWGEHTIIVDCDVLQADGGTRTAAITGGFVALVRAFKKLKETNRISCDKSYFPVKNYLAAVSVGIVNDNAILDLDYHEDSNAQIDMNVVMTGDNTFVEIQGTGEKRPFNEDEFSKLMALAKSGISTIIAKQREITGELIFQ